MNAQQTEKAVKPAPITLEQAQKMAGPDDLVEEVNGEIMITVGGKKPQKPYTPTTAVDTSERHVEQMARGFILGSESIGRRRDIRANLEERVTKKIGQKGKYLTDKLFELIDGVYVVDKVGGKEVRYYKVPPSLPAIIYALDRVLGKPKMHIEKEDTKKGVYVVESIIKNLAKPGQAPVIGMKSRVSEDSVS